MHELQCWNIRDSHGSDELHELRCRHLLNDSGGLGIDDVYGLCGGHLCCEHGIDVMRIMQHGRLLSSGR